MDEQERAWGKISKMPMPRLNNRARKRLHWKQMEPQGGCKVIKGLTHRVIIVKSPDERYFEQAIFIIRDDLFKNGEADSDAVLKEARRIANSYVFHKAVKTKGMLLKRLPAPFFAAAGAAAAGIAWLTAKLCGIA